jgi:hypothetical protein
LPLSALVKVGGDQGLVGDKPACGVRSDPANPDFRLRVTISFEWTAPTGCSTRVISALSRALALQTLAD